jgi:hypothetical protein
VLIVDEVEKEKARAGMTLLIVILGKDLSRTSQRIESFW